MIIQREGSASTVIRYGVAAETGREAETVKVETMMMLLRARGVEGID